MYIYTLCEFYSLFCIPNLKKRNDKQMAETNKKNENWKKNPYSISVLRLFAVVSTEEKRYETNRKSDFLVPYT